MGRRPSKNSNLPRGVRAREQRSGVIYYYYDAGGKPRREIPLGSNYVEAMRKWAELEAMPPSTVSKVVTFRYACEVYQQKYMLDNSPKTRREKLRQFPFLFEFFDNPPAPLEEIKPIHVRQYMAWRSKKRQDSLREKGLEVKGDEGRVAANRDKALISHVWNAARAEGLTDLPNPCAGIKSFREEGRDVYVYDDMYSKVWQKSGQVLRDAMDLAYLLGGRVADVLKVDEKHIREGALEVTQNKTNSKVRIEITGELKVLVDKILARKRSIVGKVTTTRLLVNEEGQPLTYETLRSRFDKAREDSGIPFAEFQFRDLRAKAGTDKTDSEGVRAAQGQLGHKSVTTTEIYVRKRRGQKVTPTK